MKKKPASLSWIEYAIWKQILLSNSEVLRRTINAINPTNENIKKVIKEYRQQLRDGHEKTLTKIFSVKVINLFKLMK